MSQELNKGGKRVAIGTRKEFGGREYIKTADGWKFIGKGRGKNAQKHIEAHKSPAKQEQKSTKTQGEQLDKLSEHAQNTPTENLTAVVHDESKPQELRDAAEQELKHREGGAKEVEQKHDKPEDQKQPSQDKEIESDKQSAEKQESSSEESSGLPNKESVKQSDTLAEKDGPAKLNEQTEGFSVKKEDTLTSGGDSKQEDDINHKFEAFGRFAAGVIKGRMKSLIAYGSGGVGKELWEESGVYTPFGIVKIKDLKVGDEVLTPKGTVTRVTGVFPQGVKPLYKFQLKDGSSVLAGLEHQWKVWDKTNYWCKEKKKRIASGRWVVMNTQQLIDKGIKMREKSISSNGKEIPAEWRFLIPYLVKPAAFQEKPIEIHPYMLGYLLGDGCITSSSISIAIGSQDQEESLKNLNTILSTSEYSVKEISRDKRQVDFSINNNAKLLQQLKELNLIGTSSSTKFIPKQYLYNSLENRLELLRGLMDTDGSCEGKRNHCVFYTISKQLAEDVKELALSFGKHASISLQKRKYSGLAKSSRESNGIFDSVSEIYQVYFTLPKEYNPFKLKRKAEKWNDRVNRSDVRGKSIIAIEYERDDRAVCISVEDEDKLFLTEDFITTHNTYTVTTELQKAGKKIFDPELHDPGDDGYDYVKMTGKMTAVAVYQAMYEHNGKILLFDDCDSVLQDDNSINLFKGALDTSGDGTIDWGSAKKLKDSTGQEIPGKFPFSGRAIFISNLDMNDKAGKKIQPIVSRGYGINLSMDAKKTMERIRHIATSKDGKLTNLRFPGTPDYSHEDMDAVLKYMDKHKNHAADLNVRTVGTLLAIKKDADEAGVPWEDDAKYVYLRKSNDIDIYNGSVFHQRKQAIEKALGVDNRSIEERKIDWCNMKKASLKGCVTSRDMK